MLDDAEATDAYNSVDVACAGPGDPHLNRSTDTVTTPASGAVVAESVAGDGAATILQSWRHARESVDDRGEVAESPPCDPAASQDGIEDTTGGPTGRVEALTLQATPRGEGGGGPPSWQSIDFPLALPR